MGCNRQVFVLWVFKNLAEIARANNLNELSMGMSNDYECAIKNGATFVRIGSKIFSEN